ncbi:hypothetical protein SOV_25560 [Sporomusa ovata DSM 2662]|uniref:Uncharacterized protein n=1 Tax=Sporomusa ovata TaxID=2378 RepID=A0A0U1L432_9FIRM|nr:hypothetical protein [Sporomusa ovata]EQB25869.1 hypothetical protein SOV_4c05360 [Sporomusa ovata DSM 2662]CQR74438.1 hypothetical protein SpAn4DRAFT_0900 [Sporomusa ovata]
MGQTDEKIQLDLAPFVAKAMARHREGWNELDAVQEHGWLAGEHVAVDNKEFYNRYYQQSDPLTESYCHCHKATELLLAIDREDGEKRSLAVAAVEQIIKKCWRVTYDYIKHAGPAIPFDLFWYFSIITWQTCGPRCRQTIASISAGSLERSLLASGWLMQPVPAMFVTIKPFWGCCPSWRMSSGDQWR